MQLSIPATFKSSIPSFNTASGMDCMQYLFADEQVVRNEFQYRKRYGLHAIVYVNTSDARYTVSIPQAVWIACNSRNRLHAVCVIKRFNTASGMDCMQFLMCAKTNGEASGFNTASGMDCMQCPQRLACLMKRTCFNTASGMDCMQCYRLEEAVDKLLVSIPQAVWIACNLCNLTYLN